MESAEHMSLWVYKHLRITWIEVKMKLQESKVNYLCFEKRKLRRCFKLRCLRLSVMVIKYVFIQNCSFFVWLHSSPQKFHGFFPKSDKMSVLYTSFNSRRSFCHSLSAIYLAIIKPNKKLRKSYFTLIFFIKILTFFFKYTNCYTRTPK